jgi:hypothetical protein
VLSREGEWLSGEECLDHAQRLLEAVDAHARRVQWDAQLIVVSLEVAGAQADHDQPDALWSLVQALRARGCPHLLVYSGYTDERLQRMARAQPAIGAVLADVDVLVDGPFVARLAYAAGCWTGSGNQGGIDLVATRQAGQICLWTNGSAPRGDHSLQSDPLKSSQSQG